MTAEEIRLGAVELRYIGPYRAATLTTAGPYWKLSGPLGRLRSWVEEQGLTVQGELVGIFYDDPEATPAEECRFTLAYPIDGAGPALGASETGTRAAGDVLEIRDFPQVLAAVLPFEGHARESPAAYAALDAWMEERGYRPLAAPRERYLAEPGQLEKGLMRVEVQQPVVPSERRSRERDRR